MNRKSVRVFEDKEISPEIKDIILAAAMRAPTGGNCMPYSIIDAMPTWLIDGLNVGGGMIGAVGLAILLQSITNKSLWPYFVIGFVFAAFLGINMIGVGLVAVAAVFLHNYFTSARDERPELEYEDEED